MMQLAKLPTRKKTDPAPALADYLDGAGPRADAFRKATDRLADLMRQAVKMADRLATLQAAQPDLVAAVQRAELYLQGVQNRHARGIALDEELQKATDTRAAAIAERDARRDELQTLRNGRRRLEMEVDSGRAALANARWALLDDALGQLQDELRADPGVAARLALVAAVGDGLRDPALHLAGRFDFGACLLQTFPDPDADVRAKLLAEVNALVPPFKAPAA